MTPTKTECTANRYAFGQLERRQVLADFSGGQVTTDGGLILVAQIDQHYRISERLAACFSDGRDPTRVQHQLGDLIAQRLYGLVQGYEDLNDHDLLRHDPMFGIAVGKLESDHRRCAPLAGKSSLNRLEQAMHVDTDLSKERYVKFSLDSKEIERLLVELFIEQMGDAPQQIILDMDVTDDPVHGTQEQAFFNGYYDHQCYAPLLIFCGRHLLSAKLRASTVDPAAGALEELQRIIAQIRVHWSDVLIIVRGDSAYGRDDIMRWCEAQAKVEYVLAHSSNQRLRGFTWGLEQRAKAAYEQQRQQIASNLEPLFAAASDLSAQLDTLVPPQVWYQSLNYRTEESWSCARRLVCKLTYDAAGAHRHFVVTSFSTQQVSAGKLHADYYCPRGEMENRIKEHQLDLFSDRTSTHEFESNQLRLWFSSFAYVLIQALRQHCLSQTELATAQCGTIRLKLLKVAAQIRISVRRVVIAFSSYWSGQSLFAEVYLRLQQLPRSG
jgi:hypothetical protein